MKKKLLILLLTVVAALCCALCFAGCGDKPAENSGGNGEQNNNDTTQEHIHDWGEWQVTTNATCTTQGEETRTCKLDSAHKETRKTAINPTAHTYGTFINQVPATCTDTGLQAHFHCACGKYFDEDKKEITKENLVIAKDPTAHTYGTLINQVPATCTDTGLQAHFHCACGQYFDSGKKETTLSDLEIAIDPTAHTYGTLIKKVPATCTDTGLQAHYHCACGQYFDSNKKETNLNDLKIAIDHAAHKWDSGTIIAHTTCSARGSIYYTCEYNPNHTKTEEVEIDPTAHKWNDGTVITPATCTKKGSMLFVCDYDLTHTKTEDIEIDPTAHKWNDGIVTKPETCSTKGITTYTCKYNHAHTKTEDIEIDPTAHIYSVNNICTYCQTPLNYTKNLTYKLSLDRKSYCVTGIGTAIETDIIIPYGYNNLPVTSIDSSAFYNCTRLTGITIPNSVTSINQKAFYGCKNLEKINFGDNSKLAYIADNAFYDCTSLTSISIPNSVTSIGNSVFADCTAEIKWGKNPFIKEISPYAFSKYKGTTISIPESVTSIDSSAFEDCTSLTGVYITDIAAWCNIEFGGYTANPLYYAHNLYLNNNLITEITADMLQGVTKIKDYAFNGFNGTSITIPDSVTSIGNGAFYNCKLLTSITIPESVTSIGSSAFSGCSNLISINVPNSVTSIGNYAFSGCTSLTNITIGNGVISIGDSAFEGCTNLETVYWNAMDCETAGRYDYPNNYTIFKGCTALTTVHIGENVEKILSYAFYYCTNLTRVYITDIAAWCNIEFGGYTANPLYYAHNLYLNNNLITEITADMLQGVTKIKDYAFNGFNGTSITIPDSVTSIGEWAFYGCTSLGSVTIPDNLTSIGSSAFSHCTSLESITIPFVGNGSNETHFGYIFGASSYVYNSNAVPASLKTVVITSGKSIGNRAFYNCTSLASITIPGSVTSIGSGAFEGCTSLTSVYITDMAAWCNIDFSSNPLSYAHNLYLNNSLVTEITADMLQGVTKIKDYAFNGFGGTSITIPDSVTSIGEWAFYGCTSLTSVYITDMAAWCNIDFSSNPLSYAHNLYLNNSLVTEITADMLQGVTKIKDYAFNGFGGTSITIPDSVTSIDHGAFSGCTNLESVSIGNGVTSIDYGAFSGCTNLESVSIGNGVTSIGSSAFHNCIRLTGVYIMDIAAWCNIEFDFLTYDANPLYYAHNLYLNNNLITEITADMLQGVTEIKDSAFENCTSLESITIPDSITSIGFEAFVDCTSLESVIIGDRVTSIGEWAFYGCTSLGSVTFENKTGWKVSKKEDMSNAKDVTVTDDVEQNAKLLTKYDDGCYRDYYWKRYDA